MGFAKLPSDIYAIRNRENGRIYVGMTSDLKNRVKQHFSDLRGSTPQTMRRGRERVKTLLQIDFDAYGQDVFEVYVLEENVSPEKCQEREAYWIEYYNSTNPNCGYNIRTERRQTDGIPIIHGTPPRANDVSAIAAQKV